MKNLKFFAMMLSIAAMGLGTSCSKDDEETIVGEWKLTYAETTSVEIDGNGHVYRITTTSDDYPDDFEEKMEFTKDGIVYTWVYANGEAHEKQDRYVEHDGYVVFSLENMQYKIEKLTNKKLILSYNYDGEIPDHDARYTEKIWMEFEKG